jgi:hypothetical protein
MKPSSHYIEAGQNMAHEGAVRLSWDRGSVTLSRCTMTLPS